MLAQSIQHATQFQGREFKARIRCSAYLKKRKKEKKTRRAQLTLQNEKEKKEVRAVLIKKIHNKSGKIYHSNLNYM